MSPEGLSHALLKYTDMLDHQAETAKAFFVGSLVKGLEMLKSLPQDVQERIDQLVWQATGGENISPDIISAAILRSLEERMGIIE
jgi:hypothetical protein